MQWQSGGFFRVEDECEVLLSGQLVHTITGKYHNAERFTRLLTAVIDTGCDSIDDAERIMFEGLVRDKAADAIEYAAYDFHCGRVLYEGVALLLGWFDCYQLVDNRLSTSKVYSLAFGYPRNGTDMYEYYLISRRQYLEYMRWKERREWKSHEAAYEWHEANLAGSQVLCNEFSHMAKSYKPFFTTRELPEGYLSVEQP